MRLLITTALASSVALPALAADPELTVFDWAGFEEPSIFQAYIDKHGDSPTFAFYGDDDEAFQILRRESMKKQLSVEAFSEEIIRKTLEEGMGDGNQSCVKFTHRPVGGPPGRTERRKTALSLTVAGR